MNSNKLQTILREVNAIQGALLRFRNSDGQQNLHVKLAVDYDNALHCVVANDMADDLKMSDKKVHLIQKHHDNYFFISGDVKAEADKNQKVLSIAINKASWFVRKRKGSVTWFREKCTYETNLENISAA